MAHWQDTPGHAWLYLSSDELARMPEIARRPSYEEDVEWAIAVLALPELAENKKLFGGGKEATLKLAREHCCNYYPDIYEQLTGKKATPKNSWKRAEDKFYRDHTNDWIVIAPYGDWKEGVPKGFVLGEATLGGKRKHAALRSFLIPKKRYDKRGPFGYFIRTKNTLWSRLYLNWQKIIGYVQGPPVDKEVKQANTR
ncbi:MAG: hypothetical protein WAN58_05480 [Anaerolineales bacterium]